MKNSTMLGMAALAIAGLLVLLSQIFRMPEKYVIPGVDNTAAPTVSPASPRAAASPMPSPGALKGQYSQFVGRDKQGKTAWILHAKSITLQDVEKRLEAQDIECTFYGDQQQPVATVFCDGATMRTDTQNMRFHGPVRAASPKGETFYVKNLRYDGLRKKFFGQGDVKLTRGTSVLTGDRLVADPNLKVVTVTGNVRVELRTLATRTPTAGSGEPSASTSPQGAVRR